MTNSYMGLQQGYYFTQKNFKLKEWFLKIKKTFQGLKNDVFITIILYKFYKKTFIHPKSNKQRFKISDITTISQN